MSNPMTSKRDTTTAPETYRCQFCGESSPVTQWDKDGAICPKCGAEYDVAAAIEAQEGDD